VFKSSLCKNLVDRNRLADAVGEDLRSAPGQAAHAGVLQALEHLTQRQLVELVEVPDFRGTEGVQVDLRVAFSEVAQEFFVPLQTQRGMVAALQKDLVAAEGDGLLDLLIERLARQDVGVG